MYLQADARGRVYEFEVNFILLQIFFLSAWAGHSHVCSECEHIPRDCIKFYILKYASIDQERIDLKNNQSHTGLSSFLNMNLHTSNQEQLELDWKLKLLKEYNKVSSLDLPFHLCRDHQLQPSEL